MKDIEFYDDWFGHDYGQRASAIRLFIRSLSGFSNTALGYGLHKTAIRQTL